MLASFLHATILNHSRLELALSFHLAYQLDSPTASSLLLREVMLEAMDGDQSIQEAVRADLLAVEERDSACHELYIPFLYFKGFHSLQTQRVAHWLWRQGRESLALFFQNRVSAEFGVEKWRADPQANTAKNAETFREAAKIAADNGDPRSAPARNPRQRRGRLRWQL